MKRSTSWLVALTFLNLSMVGLVAARFQGGDDANDSGGRQVSGVRDSRPGGALRQEFSVSGPEGSRPTFTLTVNPENELKVRIEAGPGHILRDPEVWNRSAPYRCVSFSVSALGRTVKTGMLKTTDADTQGGDSECASAPRFEVIDFTHLIPPQHGPIDIEVAAEGYDYHCQSCHANPAEKDCQAYCPLFFVDKTHMLDGVIELLSGG